MKHLFSIILTSSLLFTSCNTTKSFVNDDTYSVRASEVPIGESLSDETSYSAFKTRKQGKTNDQLAYADEQARLERLRCLESPFYCSTCNCTYTEWVQYQRMEMPNHRYNRGFTHAAFILIPHGAGYSAYNHMYNGYGSMYYGNGGFNYWNYGTNPLAYGYHSSLYGGYSPYNLYYSPYHNSYNPYGGYGYGGYNGFGFGFGSGLGGYGFGGNSNGWSNSGYQTSNTIKGPRGTSATGNTNPNGRAYNSNVIKSSTASTPSDKGPIVNAGRSTTDRPNTREVVQNRKPVSGTSRVNNTSSMNLDRGVNSGNVSNRPSYPATSSGESRGSNTTYSNGRTATSVPSGQSRSTVEYQRNYPSRTTAPATNGRIEGGTTNRPTMDYGTQQRTSTSSGSYSTPSRSSTPSSGGFSGGNSRSGGSVGGSTGRR